MAAELAEQIHEDFLTCKICFSEYERPKALPCLHTFCENCLRDYTESRGFGNTGRFPCPICREEINMPPVGVSGFTDNHHVKSLIYTLKSKRLEIESLVRQKDTNLLPLPGSPEKNSRSLSTSDLYNIHNQTTNSPVSIERSPISCSASDISPKRGSLPAISYPHVQVNSSNVDSQNDHGRLEQQSSQEEFTFESLTTLRLTFGKYGAGLSDFLKPKGIAVSNTGEIVLSDMGGNRILIFNENGELLKRFVCDSTVHDIGITKNKTILVVVHGKDSILMKEYSFTGKLIANHGSFYRFDNPSGLSIAADNSIVITSIENNQIYVFNEQKKFQRHFGRRGAAENAFLTPYHVTTNSKCDVIVSDYGNSAVKVFDKLGKYKYKFGREGSGDGHFSKPLGIATDSKDNIYVADSGNSRVQVFGPKGDFLVVLFDKTFNIQETAKPSNIAITASNKIVVLLTGDKFAQVRVYDEISYTAGSGGEKCVIS